MSPARNLLGSVMVLLVSLGAGCHSDPYCLNCTVGDGGNVKSDGPAPVDLQGVDLVKPADLSGTPCTVTNGGVEICDGLDNDCNGIVDDVSPAKLASDPNNCGKCGTICDFTPIHEFGACDDTSGTPTCKASGCVPGFVDADNNAANGCEYACTPTNNGVEICDGKDNNCNGQIDEGFDLTTDTANCGSCGTSCVRPNTPGVCTNGMCGIGMCASGYKDLDGNPTNGCEYQCPVNPPVAEVCNGIDDDCDGVKDNSPSDVGGSCNNFCGQVAACVANNTCSYPESTCTNGCCGSCTQGTVVCTSGTKVCQAGVRPALETCDGTDNNCDGQIDEGFNKQTDPLNCGACGHACGGTNVQAAKCTTGTCGIAACKPGYADLDGNYANGCEYSCPVYPTTVETCNGLDDDCNGVVDDNAKLTAPTNNCNTSSICAGAQPVCCGTAGWLCDYPTVNAGIEIQESAPLTCKMIPSGTAAKGGTLVFAEAKCDNIDGNCKGGVDDSFTQKGKACTVGVGICAGTGTYVCNMAGNGVTCPATANPNAASAEECNGKDDNCDGNIDERVAANGFKPGYIDRFIQVSTNLWVYEYEASRLDSTGTSGGTSSTTRACSKPGVVPWSSVTRAQAAAACSAIVLSDGTTHARLCTAPEWTTSCEGTGGAQSNSYSYSTANTTYLAGVCNDLTNNIGAPWTTGFNNGKAKQCDTPYTGGGLFDMSGNLDEWTSTSVVDNGTTYYKLRGGAYNSPSDGTPPDGTSCEFDFTILPDGFSNKDVGFRCCADKAP